MSLLVDESGFQLTIDDTVDMICPAWSLTGLVAFLRPPTVTVTNRRLNGGAVSVYPGVPGEIRLSAPFTVIGDVDHTGTPYANATAGLASNLNYLWDNVFEPVDPVRTGVLWLPDYPELTRTFDIQFENVPTDGGYGGNTIETTLSVVVSNVSVGGS